MYPVLSEKFKYLCEEKEKIYTERCKEVRLETESKSLKKCRIKILENLQNYVKKSTSSKFYKSVLPDIKKNSNLSFNIISNFKEVTEKNYSKKDKIINIRLKNNKIPTSIRKDYISLSPQKRQTFKDNLMTPLQNYRLNSMSNTPNELTIKLKDKLKDKFRESFEINRNFMF